MTIDTEDVDKALVEAASNGHLDVVKALLDPPDGRRAARADGRNGAAFVGAAFSGHAAVVLYLPWDGRKELLPTRAGQAIFEGSGMHPKPLGLCVQLLCDSLCAQAEAVVSL
jgi:hypothetical protein